MEYVCIRKCWHNRRVWNKGDIYVPLKDEKEVPHHFVPKGQEKEVNELPKLGTKVTGKSKPLASIKAPGKADFNEKTDKRPEGKQRVGVFKE